MNESSLRFEDAGTAALDNPAALARMRDTWQTNVQNMAQYVRKRGWTVTDEPLPPAGLSAAQLGALEATLGEPLPPQLRWLLGWAGEWQFGWQRNEDDIPPGDLSDVWDGYLKWSAAQLETDGLHSALLEWVDYQNEFLKDVEDEDFLKAHAALWQAHFPFAVIPCGDLLTIDTRNPDPQCQPVRYWFHDPDGDETDGIIMAPDFFSFISAWTALGCAGSDWGGWWPFVQDDGFNLQSEHARQWLTWLAQTA